MSDQFREWLALVPWLDERTALFILGGLAVVIVIWLIARSARRSKTPEAPLEGDLRIMLADVAGEIRESASETLFAHFVREFAGAGREPTIAVIRYPELVGVEDETGAVDLAEPDALQLSKVRRSENADLLVWGRAHLDDGSVTLRFAPTGSTADTGNPTRFSPAQITIPYAELTLGPGAILSTAVLGSVATTARERGLKLGGQLRPLVDRLHAVTRSEARDLPEQCRYDALRALAWGWLTLGMEDDDIDLIANAADTYKELLRFDRPDSDSRQDAELHLNYAAASVAVGEARNDADAMKSAVESALIALETYRPESHAAEWVFLQDRFARASAWLGTQQDDAAELKDSVTAFHNVLGLWRMDKAPALWAVTERRLADALAALGRRSVGTGALEQAAAVYRKVLLSKEAAEGVVDRAELRRSLAQVLTDLGSRLGQSERHEEAIQALQLMEKPVEPGVPAPRDPETKRALGHAALALASTSQNPLDMAKAARALKEATSLRPDGPMDMAWSETYRDLGIALAALGTQRRRQPLLRDSIGALHTALDGANIDTAPAAWEEIQRKLAEVQLKLARMGDGVPAADSAIETFDRLLTIYGDGTEAHKVAEAYEGRGEAHMVKARASEDEDNVAEELQQAIVSYRDALQKVDKSQTPLLWARLQSRIGDALAFSGGHGGEADHLSESASAYRAALEIWTPVAAPMERGKVLNSLAHVLADMEGDGPREEAARAFEEAAQLFASQGASEHAASAEWSLRRPKPEGTARITPWTPPPEAEPIVVEGPSVEEAEVEEVAVEEAPEVANVEAKAESASGAATSTASETSEDVRKDDEDSKTPETATGDAEKEKVADGTAGEAAGDDTSSATPSAGEPSEEKPTKPGRRSSLLAVARAKKTQKEPAA